MINYEISFWNYVHAYKQGVSAVDEMYEMGCTHFMSPEYLPEEGGKENMCAILRRCEELQMSCLVYDHRITAGAYAKYGEERYIQNLKEIYQDYENYSAAKYCFIKDEPNTDEEYTQTKRCCELLRVYMPTMKPFVAFNHVGMRSEKDGERIFKLNAEMKSDFFLYNCYSQCLKESHDKQQGLQNYYHNLYKFMELGKAHGKPVYQSILQTGHWMIGNPSQAQIRWQFNVGAASGVQGFYFFHPYELDFDNSFHGYAVVVGGHKTEKYYQSAYEARRFKERVAPRLKEYTHMKTYHFLNTCGYDYEQFYRDKDDVIMGLTSKYNRPLVIGKFQHDKEKNKYLIMLVNASQTEEAYVSVILKGEKERNVYLSAGSEQIFKIEIKN